MTDKIKRQCLEGILTIDRIHINVTISSKKRLLEELAISLSSNSTSLNKDTVSRTLTERERLGSTGIGGGIALPHGRLNGIDDCIAAIIRLREPLNFDSPDAQPIILAIGLLVPADASNKHLKILSSLATMFNDSEKRKSILSVEDPSTLLKFLT
ncbi:MAG: PTS sugar transporter subunit IIA [Acidiferrobacteraceae bacterium]|jgi:PTS system nitrogen regulatory IIA component|nr:PTS sugar transporter subunit IIA [Acidiferrobacteraceae bacterium]|tara:strand:+ start:3751 stop:4215 length:465 start_codon:yes stop_codon:yes gene_type:complete